MTLTNVLESSCLLFESEVGSGTTLCLMMRTRGRGNQSEFIQSLIQCSHFASGSPKLQLYRAFRLIGFPNCKMLSVGCNRYQIALTRLALVISLGVPNNPIWFITVVSSPPWLSFTKIYSDCKRADGR